MSVINSSNPPLTHRSTVQQWECDHMGHLNVRHYMAKFDDAAWTFLSMLGLTNHYFQECQAGVAAVDHHVTYKRELMPGDCVEIHTKLALLDGRKFKLIHEMTHSVSGEVAASCELFGVHMDRQERRAVPFPDHILAAGQKYLTVQEEAAQ
ncbi:acyl-CoA thioesterase [Terasakiella brassicae]|nr:thioesterase family protein [Terasakiella brassicae]